MQSKDWIALASVLATALISVVSLVLNRRSQREHLARDDRLHKEQQAREDRIRQEERRHAPHIEFSIDCHAYGPEGDAYLVELLLIARNRGTVQQKFRNIRLRVRAIEDGQPLAYWQGHEPRLHFPIELIDDVSVIPRGYNYFFVEPGVEQVITYVTRIPASVRYILAHARFEYDEQTPHTAERVFQIGPAEGQMLPGKSCVTGAGL